MKQKPAPLVTLAGHSAVMIDKTFETAWLVLFKPSESTRSRLKKFNRDNKSGVIKGPWSRIEVHQFHGWSKWPGTAKIVTARYDSKNDTCLIRIFNLKMHRNSMEC